MRAHKIGWLMPDTHTCMVIFFKEETYWLMLLFEARSHVSSLRCGPSLLGSILETEEAEVQFLPFCPILTAHQCVLVMCCSMWLAQQWLEPLCNTEAPTSLPWLSSAVWISLEPPLDVAVRYWLALQSSEGSNGLIIRIMQACGCSPCRLLPGAKLDCLQLISPCSVMAIVCYV